MIRLLAGIKFFMIVTLICLNAHAEIKVIEAENTYAIGDNDSKVDARRIATQEATRKALELAGTYVASLTQVKEYRLSKDEVTTYTAGVVETDIVSEEMRGTTKNPEIYIKARCKIDTAVLMEQIDRYRENQELREQLEASTRESGRLRKEREELLKQLAAERDKEKAAETRKKLDAVLTRAETIDDTNRVWAGLAQKIDFYGEKGAGPVINQQELDNASAVLERAVKTNPRDLRARMVLAAIYQRRGDDAASERELRSAMELDPMNPLFHMKLGVLLKKQGRYDEALKEFQFIERKRPNEPHMLFMTGMTHKAKGNCRMAIAYLKRFMMFTKRNDRPRIAPLKQRALEARQECGDRPGARPAGQRSRFR
jgi:tetratricopeptide (TPR) repeat protein